MHGKAHTLKTKKLMSMNRPSYEGSKNPASKIDEKKAIEIRNLYEMGLLQKDLSIMFGINQRSISNIVTNKTWKNCIYM